MKKLSSDSHIERADGMRCKRKYHQVKGGIAQNQLCKMTHVTKAHTN
jgi:hypothetical protein